MEREWVVKLDCGGEGLSGEAKWCSEGRNVGLHPDGRHNGLVSVALGLWKLVIC